MIPKFEKTNHHYVPQHWQEGFRGPDNHLYGRFRDGSIRAVAPRKIMQQAHLNTIFDAQWNPSDALEDALSKVERDDAELIKRLQLPGYTSTATDREHLCHVLALQAVRHPDILKRGVALSHKLGKVLASAHDYSQTEFEALMATFGVCTTDAHNDYCRLRSLSKERLTEELVELLQLSPQSPQLPAQDALRTKDLLAYQLQQMELVLLDAPDGEAFILGDTPIPQSDLCRGFTVPLSQSLAVLVQPQQQLQESLARRTATSHEVNDINRMQFNNALDVVVGPSIKLLEALGALDYSPLGPK